MRSLKFTRDKSQELNYVTTNDSWKIIEQFGITGMGSPNYLAKFCNLTIWRSTFPD